MSDDDAVKPWRDLVRRFVEDAIGLCEESECSNLPTHSYVPACRGRADGLFFLEDPIYLCAKHAQNHADAWKVDWAPVLHDALKMLGEAE